MEREDILSVKEAANALLIAESTLRNKLSKNEDLPFSFKYGRRRFFYKEDVKAWLNVKLPTRTAK